MIDKIIFILVVIYFVYQLVISFREKEVNKKITGLAVGCTILILTCTRWPFYLNYHLSFGILTILYAVGMFYESARAKRGFYFLTGVIILILSGFQFASYFGL